jgi:hypothetical protein
MTQTGKYTIAAQHEAFGIEGSREYTGTDLGAKAAARKIAKAAGHSWHAVVVKRAPEDHVCADHAVWAHAAGNCTICGARLPLSAAPEAVRP